MRNTKLIKKKSIQMHERISMVLNIHVFVISAIKADYFAGIRALNDLKTCIINYQDYALISLILQD